MAEYYTIGSPRGKKMPVTVRYPGQDSRTIVAKAIVDEEGKVVAYTTIDGSIPEKGYFEELFENAAELDLRVETDMHWWES